MFSQFPAETHVCILKGKQGEFRALSTAGRATKDRLLPILVAPPAGDFDHDEGRPLSPLEHLGSFGQKLYRAWGQRLTFIDAGHVDDPRHKEGLSVHPLTELLERARLAGAMACPVTGLGRSPEYQSAVLRFVERQAPLPICVRVDAISIQAPSFHEDLRKLIAELKCPPSRIVLVLDFGPVDLTDFSGFADVLVHQINDLPHVAEWLSLAVAVTTFPDKIAIPAGQVRQWPRHDWLMYQRLIQQRGRLLRIPLYGDYAVEYPKYSNVPKGVRPSALIRYATPDDYVLYKGASTRKEGYAAIFPVALALTTGPDFSGPTFSQGDFFFQELAVRVRGPGNASTWRWAATDHYLAITAAALRELFGIEVTTVTEDLPEGNLFTLGAKAR